MTRKKTHEEFVEQLNKIHGEGTYTPLEKYKGVATKILIRHNRCGYEWVITPSHLLRGHGCPKCAGNIKKTTEEFKKEIKDKYCDDYSILGEYINNNTKILVRHNSKECSYYEWKITPSNLLRDRCCPICGKLKNKNNQTKTHESFVVQLNYIYGNEVYIPLEKYINARTKILVRHNCNKCKNHEWETTPANLLTGYGCPVCSGRTAKLGINTIWDTDRWMVDLGVSEEDAKRYSRCSGKKIIVTCPDCGTRKGMTIDHIYKRKTIGCPCGDGRSYPEKFIYNLLKQLNLEFETEYSPDWIKPKRYDFHIKDNDCIIETHGKQHYSNISNFSSYGGKKLEEEKVNDRYKKETALKNGIKHYIELDCSESNMDYIKNSILNSKLAKLFDLSNIDWNKCAEFANKNIVKEVCEYWNNKREYETTKHIENIFKLNRNTIIAYLKRGNKLGWCNYNAKEEIMKCGSKSGKLFCKQVEMFKNGQNLGRFPSVAELERQSEELFGIKLFRSAVSRVCNNKASQYKGYQFKYIENVA